jgi:methylmalonyl-CoA/ethylmalonyl-CoA epimerase
MNNVSEDNGISQDVKVCHWGYVVPNINRALKGWLAEGSTLVVPPAVDPIQNVSCCLVLFAGFLPIELVAPLPTGPNPVATKLSKGGGLDHVCVFTDNMDEDILRFQERGGNLVVNPCYGAVFDRQLAFIMTRAGLVVELMNRKAVGHLTTDPLGSFKPVAGVSSPHDF